MRNLTRCTLLTLAAGVTAAQSVRAQEPTQPRTHTVVRGDNLWDLSQTYLGNPFLWPEIYRLNRDVVEDPHWIYPGEVLRLPGPTTVPDVSQQPAQPETPTPQTPTPVEAGPPVDPAAPTVFTRRQPVAEVATPGGGPTFGPEIGIAPPPTVRAGEVMAAPYVDREGGPRGFGRILKSGDLSGVGEATERFRFQAFDRVFIAPPVGNIAAEGERYLSVRLGPIIEEQGQVIIPTGIVEVTRAARADIAAVAKVVRSFREVTATDRLIPIDTAGVGTTVRPQRVADGPSTTIVWIHGEPVLPSVQHYVVLGVSSKNGVRMGDEFMIYKPIVRVEEGQAKDPEIMIAKAQVVRSTPYGVTAVLVGQEQPSIKEGMTARWSARMP
jgi:hypothetical protein